MLKPRGIKALTLTLLTAGAMALMVSLPAVARPAEGEASASAAADSSAETQAEESPPVGNGATPADTDLQTGRAAIESRASVDPISQYMDAIRGVEVNRGAYSLELADLYLGLGNLLVKARKYPQAKDAFQKGMQVARINNGLHSLSQEPFLFSLADLDSALGDIAGSNKAMTHILQINTETYGETDPRLLPALERMFHWYLDNYPYQGPNQGLEFLLNSEQLANHMLLIHMDTLKLADAGAEASFRRLSAVEFALARHVETHGLPGKQEAFSYSFGATPNQVPQEPSFIARYYRTGRDALKSVVQLLYDDQDADPRELAEAVAELGDWYAAFDKHSAAEDHYKLAYKLLGESEESRAMQQSFFAEPRLIDFDVRDNGAIPVPLQSDEALAITLDITERGIPDNLRLEDKRENLSVREVKKIKRHVLKHRFRPQLRDGELVDTRDYIYHYPVAVAEAKANNES